ncbi:MAG: 50S ribosomal protein L22 [Patescibacteria group bacterium]|jgi:large subunit ribosomal protein L22
METKATAKFTRISPKKAQPMVKALRGATVTDAMAELKYHSSKTARILYKLIKSATNNAINNYNLKETNLRVKTLTVDTGPTMKRYWFRSHGSADPLLKRSSHFAVVLEEIKPTLIKKKVEAPKSITTTSAPSSTAAETAVTPTTDLAPKSKLPKPKLTKGLKQVFTRRTTNK